MPTNYDNCVCQVKAKTGSATTVTKGFCDVQQVEIPMYLAVSEVLDSRKNEQSPPRILKNVWSEGQIVTAYNSIPANTIQFCNNYFSKFGKYPNFNLFLYDAQSNENDGNSFPYRNTQSLKNVVVQSMTPQYYNNTSVQVNRSNQLLSFINGTDTTDDYIFRYGLDTSKDFELDDTTYGEHELILYRYNKESKEIGERQGSKVHGETAGFDNTYCLAELTNAENETATAYFVFEFIKETSGEINKFRLTKIEGQSLSGETSAHFGFYYNARGQRLITSIQASCEINLYPFVTLRNVATQNQYVESFQTDRVIPYIVLRATEDGFDAEMMSLCVLHEVISQPSSETIKNDIPTIYPDTITSLLGDAVQYVYSNEQNGDDPEEEQARPFDCPIFYLDEDLNLPEFWNTTDETTL